MHGDAPSNSSLPLSRETQSESFLILNLTAIPRSIRLLADASLCGPMGLRTVQWSHAIEPVLLPVGRSPRPAG